MCRSALQRKMIAANAETFDELTRLAKNAPTASVEKKDFRDNVFSSSKTYRHCVESKKKNFTIVRSEVLDRKDR